MRISARLACQLVAGCHGEPGPAAADILTVLDAAIAEDATLSAEYDRFRRHISDYDVRETLNRTGDAKLATERAR